MRGIFNFTVLCVILSAWNFPCRGEQASFSEGVRQTPLSANPSAEQLGQVPDLPLALRPIEGTDSEAERVALASAIVGFRDQEQPEDLSVLETFVQQHPDSVWTPSVYLNLGSLAYRCGRFKLATENWKKAWELAKDDSSPDGQRIANCALMEYGRMLARVGELSQLEATLDLAKERTFIDSDENLRNSNTEALWMMKNIPGVAFRCGPLALASICKELKIPLPSGYAENTQSPVTGFSLKEVRDLSQNLGLNYRAVYRQAGSAILVPSVIHWKLNHYGAIIRERDGRYLMIDPTFGSQHWITKETIDLEASGYFLVGQNALPQGWSLVEDQHASQVFGKGMTNSSDGSQTGQKAEKCKDGKCPPGMPGYDFDALLASLTVQDIPIPYTPAFGPSLPFKVSYNQREEGQDSSPAYSNFGPRWECSWISFLTDNGSSSSHTSVQISLPGGGGESFDDVTDNIDTSPRAKQSNARMVRLGENTYERLMPDGSKQVYGMAIGTSAGRKIFMSRVVDAQGNAIELGYDTSSASPVRLTQVTYPDGATFSLFYENSSRPNYVTKVSDSFGRQVVFSYSESGEAVRLTQVTDVIGIQSGFTYDAAGKMLSMTTPYGTTSFNYDDATVGGKRWVQATDPYGDSERVEFLADNPAIQPSTSALDFPSEAETGIVFRNNFLNYRNSFYWSKKAWEENAGDYSKAKIYHWLHGDGGPASGIIESIKLPFMSRIWYRYPGSDPIALMNDSNPVAMAQKVEGTGGGAVAMVERYEYQDVVTGSVHSNPFGLMTKSIDPVGRETTFEYVNQIDPRYVKRKNGSSYDTLVEYQYDSAYPAHRPKTIIGANGQSTTYTYNTRGQVVTVTNALGETTTLTYGTSSGAGYGRLTKVQGPVDSGSGAQAVVEFTYDAIGRVTKVKDVDGDETLVSYDALNRPTSITYPDGLAETYTYDKLDRASVKDREGRITRYRYNALRQLVLTTDPLGRNTQMTWCKCGGLKSLVDGNGNLTRWRHDAQSRVTAKIYADGSEEVYGYQPLSSRLGTITDPAGQITTRTYNLDGSLNTEGYSNAAVATPGVGFVYDGAYLRVVSMTDGTGTTAYTYHPVGSIGALQVASEDSALSGTTDKISYSYDALDRLVGRNIGSGTSDNLVTWQYDALGRTTQKASLLGTLTYGYDGNSGRLVSSAFPGSGLASFYEYFGSSGLRRLKKIAYSPANALTSVISSHEYTYQPGGNIATWKRNNGLTDTITAYGYDAADQLLTALTAATATPSVTTETLGYSYDRAGNRQSEQRDTVMAGFTFNNLNQVQSRNGGGGILVRGNTDEPAQVTVNGKSVTPTADNTFETVISGTNGANTIAVTAKDFSPSQNTQTKSWSATMSAGTTATYTYDGNGNMTGDGSRTFQWDAKNRLTRIVYFGTNASTEMAYDGLDRRVSIVEKDGTGTVVSSKSFVWDGLSIADQRIGSTVSRQYFSEGWRDASAGTNYFYERDHLGSVREVVSVSSSVLTRYDYDAYGRVTKLSGTVESDFQYTGHYAHLPSALYFAPFRAYNAGLGRWISRDPLPMAELSEGANLYFYVNNNPVNLIDIDGQASIRTYINSMLTAISMWLGPEHSHDPRDIKPMRTPTSERQKTEGHLENEKKKRGSRSRGSAKCLAAPLLLLWDQQQDIDFVLDYDFDKSFQENLFNAYGNSSLDQPIPMT